MPVQLTYPANRSRENISEAAAANNGHYGLHPGVATFFLKEDQLRDNISQDRTWNGFRPAKDLFRLTREYHQPTISGVSDKEIDGVPMLDGVYITGWAGQWSTSQHSQKVALDDELDTSLTYRTDLIGRSNPGRPHVSLPVMAAEMLELTLLFRLKTRTFASMLGSAYLNYKFGWATLFADLQKFLSITKVVESRIREFNSLVQYGSFTRKMTLDGASASKTFPETTIYNVGRSKVKGTGSRSTKAEVTGSITYEPSLAPEFDGFIPTEPVEQFNTALRHALDLDAPDPDTLWEIIPFSWLVDYFYEIGPWLEATNDDFGLKIREVSIIKKSEETIKVSPTTCSWRVASMNKNSGVGYETRVERKSWNELDRKLIRPNWNLLNRGQILTIAALIASMKL